MSSNQEFAQELEYLSTRIDQTRNLVESRQYICRFLLLKLIRQDRNLDNEFAKYQTHDPQITGHNKFRYYDKLREAIKHRDQLSYSKIRQQNHAFLTNTDRALLMLLDDKVNKLFSETSTST